MNKLFLLLGMLFINFSAIGQTKNFIDQAYVETSAKVDTFVTPDRIFLSILISENDTKGKQTVEELERQMATKLMEIGIDLNKQLVLSDLSSNFKKYFLRKQDILKAKAYELEVFDAATAGRVIYEMEGIGISNVDLERTEYSKIEELKLDLRSKAILKAKSQTIAMLEPLNQRIRHALFISDIQTNNLDGVQITASGISRTGYSFDKKEKYEAQPIEFEKIKVESQVEVKFAINGN